MNEVGYLYIILNTINGKFYLGSTLNPKKREKKHFRDLEKGKHHSIILQRAYNKYGKHNFKFILIETTYHCREREDFILKNVIDYKDSYNVSNSSSGGDLITNHPNREEIIKSSTERLRRAKRPSPKYREDNPNWKGGISKSNCVSCGKEIKAGNKKCKDCFFKERDYSGSNNPFYGKTHSEETIKKILENRVDNYFPITSTVLYINGIKYNSYGEAERETGIQRATIRYRCISKNILYKDYYKEGEEKKEEELYKAADKRKKRKVVCDGVLYESINEAARQMMCSVCKVSNRINSENYKDWYYES